MSFAVATAVLRTQIENGIPGYGFDKGVWVDDIRELRLTKHRKTGVGRKNI
jgi:hypothetical protein